MNPLFQHTPIETIPSKELTNPAYLKLLQASGTYQKAEVARLFSQHPRVKNRRSPLTKQRLDIDQILLNHTELSSQVLGGRQSLTAEIVYSHIDPAYHYLVTPEMFAVLVGILASDGYVDQYGAVFLLQTIRDERNYELAVFMIYVLGPIISSVEISTGPVVDEQGKIIKTQTLVHNFCQKYGSLGSFNLDFAALNEDMSRLAQEINKYKNQPAVVASRDDQRKTIKGQLKQPWSIRIKTYSLFKNWRTDWYALPNPSLPFYNELPKNKNIKKWPLHIEDIYVSPITLAVHLMFDGSSKAITDSKETRSCFYLGGLDGEIFSKVLKKNFGIKVFCAREGSKKSTIAWITSGEKANARADGSNQQLAYQLISPFIIPVMSQKLYNVNTPNRVHALRPLTNKQKAFLPINLLVPNSYQYTKYNGFFDDQMLLCYRGCHSLEMPNKTLIMPLAVEKLFQEYYNLQAMAKYYLNQQIIMQLERHKLSTIKTIK